jgi:hypothetical protein
VAEAQVNETDARKELERLIVENPDLERLEAFLNEFNIFEAIGMVNQEIRHSKFLSFLLDPKANHGLGDFFLKRILLKALRSSQNEPAITLFDLDGWNLESALVRTEAYGIDILIEDETNRLAVIVENKLFTGEHSDQLKRYYDFICGQHPDWRIQGLFLTPEGDEPSHEHYCILSYGQIAELVDAIVTQRESALGIEVKTLLCHYAQMLRRNIVSDSDISKLCKQIYQNHRQALDKIFEYRPDERDDLRVFLENLIKLNDLLDLDRSRTSWICFAPKEWDDLIPKTDLKWSDKGRTLMFWFENQPDRLRFALEIGPGDMEIRNRLFLYAKSHTDTQPPLFNPKSKESKSLYSRIWTTLWLMPQDYERCTTEELHEIIQKKWKHFVDHDLQQYIDAIKEGLRENDD